MKRLLSLVFASLFGAATASAGILADVTIVDRTTGERLPVYSHAGRLYVAGTPGNRYAVEIANRSGARLLAVVSVDGVNVVTGETAAPNQSGYVFTPGQRYPINGWRKSLGEIAAFYFTALPDSYAARTDRPDNVGVIGVALFRELPRPRPPVSVAPPRPAQSADGASQDETSSLEKRRSAASASASASGEAAASPSEADTPKAAEPPAPAERLGTGHGEREESRVTYTHFRRGSAPNETIVVHYDSRANLLARGVIPRALPIGTPNPFPGGKFVPDPRG